MRGVGYTAPASPWSSSAYPGSPASGGYDRADFPVNTRVRVKAGLDFQHFKEGDCGTVTSVKADSIREVLFDDQAVPLPVARRHLELVDSRSPRASRGVSPVLSRPRSPQLAPATAMPLPGRPRSPLQPRSPPGSTSSPAAAAVRGVGAFGADSPVRHRPLSPERQPTNGFGAYAADSPVRLRPLSPGPTNGVRAYGADSPVSHRLVSLEPQPTNGVGAYAADSPVRHRPLSPGRQPTDGFGAYAADSPVRRWPLGPDSHTKYPAERDLTTYAVLRGESGRSPSPSHLSGPLGRRAVSSTTSPTMASQETASLMASLREERRAREALELQVKTLIENNGQHNQILISKEADALKENDALRRSVEDLRRQLAAARESRRPLREDIVREAVPPRDGGAGHRGTQYVDAASGGALNAQGQGSAEQVVYVADNSVLKAKTQGIHYRVNTTLENKDDPGQLLRWGNTVKGIECMGGEWLKVEGHGYLPMRLDGVQVLKRKATRGAPSCAPSCWEGFCGTASGPSRSPGVQAAAIADQQKLLSPQDHKAGICIVGATGLRPGGAGSELFCRCRIRGQKADAAETARSRQPNPVWESGHALGLAAIAGRKLDFEVYSSQTGSGGEKVSYLGKATVSVDKEWLGASEIFEVDLPLSRYCCGAGSLKVRLCGVKPLSVKARRSELQAGLAVGIAEGQGRASGEDNASSAPVFPWPRPQPWQYSSGRG